MANFASPFFRLTDSKFFTHFNIYFPNPLSWKILTLTSKLGKHMYIVLHDERFPVAWKWAHISKITLSSSNAPNSAHGFESW